MPELSEIDQHNSDVNVVYYNAVEVWCFALKLIQSFIDLGCIKKLCL